MEEMRAQRLSTFAMRSEAPPRSPPPPYNSDESSDSSASLKSNQSKDARTYFNPNLQRAGYAGLNMSNMRGVTFRCCTFSLMEEMKRETSAGMNSSEMEREKSAGLNMSNMTGVTFEDCTFSHQEMEREKSAGINMFNMTGVTFQHCTFSHEESTECNASFKNDQSKPDILNLKKRLSARSGNLKKKAGDHDVVKQKNHQEELKRLNNLMERKEDLLRSLQSLVPQKRKSDGSKACVKTKKKHSSPEMEREKSAGINTPILPPQQPHQPMMIERKKSAEQLEMELSSGPSYVMSSSDESCDESCESSPSLKSEQSKDASTDLDGGDES